MPCFRKFTALSKSRCDKMQRAKEIDITNDNHNEELNDQTGFSFMNKRSEIKFAKPSRTGIFSTGIFSSLCLFCNIFRIPKLRVLNKRLLMFKPMIFKNK